MKAFSDIGQSNKLADILPLESADMAWCNSSIRGVNYTDEYSANLYTVKKMQECFDETFNGWDKYWKLIPCWSLAALLNVLEHPRCFQGDKPTYWFCGCFGKDKLYHEVEADNPIDACYEMIIKLHELKVL